MIRHLSYSSVNIYLYCAKSWEFRYIIKPDVPVSVNLPFGSAVHETVQTYVAAKALHPDQVRPLVELWSPTWRDVLAEQKREIKWEKPKDYYAELGKTMLTTPEIVQAIDAIEPMVVTASTSMEPSESVIMERRVNLRVPGVPIPVIGYIDMLAADGTPIDFKTAGRAWSKGKEHNEIQPDFYLAALNQEGYNFDSGLKFRYYIFTKTKNPRVQVLETSRDFAQLFWMTQVVGEVWRGIEAGVFPMNPTGWKCSPKYCEYYPLCRGRKL